MFMVVLIYQPQDLSNTILCLASKTNISKFQQLCGHCDEDSGLCYFRIVIDKVPGDVVILPLAEILPQNRECLTLRPFISSEVLWVTLIALRNDGEIRGLCAGKCERGYSYKGSHGRD